MQQLVYITLYGWPLVSILLFLWMPVRQAILVTFLGGWMFLPMATIRFQGVPDFDKATVIVLGVMLGLAIRNQLGRLFDVRPHWLDLPMAIWLALPLISAISVGTGMYDGVSGMFSQAIIWGLPYWIGRAFFNSPAAVRTLAFAIVVAGLVYVPLCFYEVRFSPQLHNIIYGSHQHDFRQTVRFGGYRPMVFMTHGLMVAMFMATATLMAVGLWCSGVYQRLLYVPMGVWVALLAFTTLLSRSTGAVGLMLMGGAAMLMAERYRRAWPVVLLALVPPIYVFSRLGQTELPQQMVAAAEVIVGEARADSLNFRIQNEELLMRRAFEAPLFGWRGWNLARQVRPDLPENELPIAESMWILALGRHGLVGLATFLSLMLIAPVWLFYRAPKPLLPHPIGGPIACMCLGTILFSIDSMFNAMLNPMFMLMLGTVTGVLLLAREPQPGVVHASGHGRTGEVATPTSMASANHDRQVGEGLL